MSKGERKECKKVLSEREEGYRQGERCRGVRVFKGERKECRKVLSEREKGWRQGEVRQR